MNNILSWSLEAIDTCPGSVNEDGTVAAVCSMCYATGNRYRFKNVVNARRENKLAWQKDSWITEMVSAINNQRYFRWFDSGDIYDMNLLDKIIEIIKLTPETKHWIPTRMHKFPEFKIKLDELNTLKNVAVRYSADSIYGVYDPDLHGSVVIPHANFVTDAFICPSSVTDGKCGNCRACWNKKIGTIAYSAIGEKATKIYNTNAEAAG